MSTELIAFLVIVYIIGMFVSRYVYYRLTPLHKVDSDEVITTTFLWPLIAICWFPLTGIGKLIENVDELGKKHRKK